MGGDLPAPGELKFHDCRAEQSQAKLAGHAIRLLQWNIERGYKLPEIIAELRKIDADIIALQEIDIGCERSSNADTGLEIAQALQLNYVFFCEFEELHSPSRDARSQGGGVHGNGFLSRFDIHDVRIIKHRTCPLDWEDKTLPAAQREPRHGQRAILAATFATPQGPLLCYNLHMEVFCGMLARIEQFVDVFRDSREQLKKGMYHQAILGDLNTMAHGIARLSPNFCNDRMRFLSIGQSEATFWHQNLFLVPDLAFWPSRDGKDQPPQGPEAPAMNQRLRWWGVPGHVCQEALNPGFHDPWDPQQDITLDNPNYRFLGFSLAAGKLDWLLMRRLQVVSTGCGNHNYAASDHKWLQADVHLAGS